MLTLNSTTFLILFSLFVQCFSRQLTQSTFQNVTVHLKLSNQTQQWRSLFIIEATSATSFLNKTNAKVTVIHFKKQKIPVLFKNCFEGVTKVSKLKLNGCGIEEVQPGILPYEAKIFELDFSDNGIRDIKHGVFTNMDITRLCLNNNKIHEIQNKAFSNMRNLEMVILSNNRLTEWDSSWFLKTPVRHVDFSSNFIEVLPPGAFDYFREFKKKFYGEFYYINFNNNFLTKLQKKSLPDATSLWFLFLEKNFIEEIEEGFFGDIKKMEALKLGNNHLRSFSNELLGDLNLKFLKLDDNSIGEIDVNITEILNIDKNPLTQDCRRQWNERKTNDRVRFHKYLYDP